MEWVRAETDGEWTPVPARREPETETQQKKEGVQMATKKKTASAPATAPAASPTPAVTAPPTAATATAASQTPPITGVANGSNRGTKVEIQTSYLALIAGLLAYYQPDDEFLLEAGTVTRDELIDSFQQFVGTAEATKTSNQAWRDNVQTERAAERVVSPLRAGVKSILEGRFGKGGMQLVKFGFTPAKAGVRTTAAKTAAVEKSKATRVARGTKGSAQKKEITGDVTGVVITPVTTGTAAPKLPAPAANASNAAPTSNGAVAPAATAVTPPRS
jgi:hypothetical protein